MHCTQVVLTLIGLQLDAVTIAAGLLHDVVEDVEEVTIEQLAAEFGEEVAVLVNGVTKITGLSFRSQEELQAEYFRKMLVSMAKDVRIILIKLADRLHNMRTLSYLAAEKQQRISLETREIYAPLAHRFGMAKIKSELEDLSLKYLSPDVYRDLASKLDQKRAEREKLIDEIRQPIVKALKDAGIDATVNGRAKHFPQHLHEDAAPQPALRGDLRPAGAARRGPTRCPTATTHSGSSIPSTPPSSTASKTTFPVPR